MPLRMLDYWVRLRRQYGCGIEQVAVYLKRSQSPLVFENRFEEVGTYHQYRVIRLWEAEPSLFLNTPFLLPLATLAKITQPELLLKAVAERVDIIKDSAEGSNAPAYVQ